MNDSGESRFDAKVRFAREVEAYLAEPELPPSPHLVLRVRERVLREQLRRRRRAEVRRWVLVGGGLAATWSAVLVATAAPFGEWVRRLAGMAPVQAAVHTAALGIAQPLEVLSGAGTVGMWTLDLLLVGFALYLLRDLFVDPLKGMPFGRSFRR